MGPGRFRCSGLLEDLQRHLAHALAQHAELLRRASRQVDDAPFPVRTAVIDAAGHAPTAGHAGDPDLRAERQFAMGGSELVAFVTLAARRTAALELAPVVRRVAGFDLGTF